MLRGLFRTLSRLLSLVSFAQVILSLPLVLDIAGALSADDVRLRCSPERLQCCDHFVATSLISAGRDAFLSVRRRIAPH